MQVSPPSEGGPDHPPEHLLRVGPDRVIGRGHPAGDFLQAYEWDVIDEAEGRIRVSAGLPDHALNPRGQLFGGFTGVYVDLLSLIACRAGADRSAPGPPRPWMTTINMRIDYYEPILGPTFELEAEVEHRRGRTYLVATRMFQDDVLAVFAIATMREVVNG